MWFHGCEMLNTHFKVEWWEKFKWDYLRLTLINMFYLTLQTRFGVGKGGGRAESSLVLKGIKIEGENIFYWFEKKK